MSRRAASRCVQRPAVAVVPPPYNSYVKRCSKCEATKPLAEFYRMTATKDGRRPECKACFDARRRRWYEKNREREIARVRSWQQANPERVKAWRDKNRGRRLKKLREIHLRN